MSAHLSTPQRAIATTEVTAADLPLHCPLPADSVWNSHPRVFLPIQENGEATCPYCGAHYVLKDWDSQSHRSH